MTSKARASSKTGAEDLNNPCGETLTDASQIDADAVAFIRRHAEELGIDAVGFCAPNLDPLIKERLSHFIAEGRHGDMNWMEERIDQRSDPKALWPNVETIIMLGMNYGPETDPLAGLEDTSSGTISVYARGRDYHDVFKKRLKALARTLTQTLGGDLKVFVDTAPVSEKPLAELAGVGWQGKHTNLVSREFGSWLFLGAIFTTLKLPTDQPEIDHCGGCTRCLDVCPTAAFPAPYQLDAQRCVAYLTIEHKGPIPRELREGIGNRIYGCDDCLAVCPWNKFAQEASEARLKARKISTPTSLKDLSTLDDASFRKLFAGSPIKRTGRDRFIRNVLVAIGNSNDKSLATAAHALLDDASPLVRGAAAWAYQRIGMTDEIATTKRQRLSVEKDRDVIEEWLRPPIAAEKIYQTVSDADRP